MTPSSPLRNVVVGFAAGLIGGALHQAAAALVDPAYLQTASWTVVLGKLQAGAVWGVAFAFLYRIIPGGYLSRVVALALLTTIARFTVFADPAMAFTGSMLAKSLSLNTVFAVACVFVLRQAFELALPMAEMARRAEEFYDDPAGAHEH